MRPRSTAARNSATDAVNTSTPLVAESLVDSRNAFICGARGAGRRSVILALPFSRSGSDEPDPAKPGDVSLGVSEFGEDLLRMLADGGRGTVAGRAVDRGHEAGTDQRDFLWKVSSGRHAHQHVPVRELRVGEHLRQRIDSRRGDALRREPTLPGGGAFGCQGGFDVRLQLDAVRPPRYQ